MSEPALQEDGDHVEEAPLSEAEERFLVDIRGQVRQLFVVVNKMDMLGETERKEVLGYIHSRVEQIVGIGAAQLSPLSARDGLTTKLNHDDVGIHRSGLTAFEQALTAFLAEAQGRTFLVSVMDRALHLFAQADPALAMATSDCEIEPPGSAFELRRTMESLRASLLAGTPLSAAHHAQELAVADPRVIEQAIAASRSPVHEAGDGQAQARARTCPICAAQAQALFAFFAKWQYRLATDTMAQRAFAAERGLCPVHTWQFQEMASPQGISDGYAPLIETLAVELSRLSEQSVECVAAPLAALLASTATCAACRLVLVTAAEQVEQLLAHLVTAQDREEYASSAGLCLPPSAGGARPRGGLRRRDH